MTDFKRRELNGYWAIYVPDHPGSYTSDNWDGYIYEHRYIMEKSLDRLLTKDEVVHHLDCDKLNNKIENLIVLANRGSHLRLHHWIDAGAPLHEDYIKKNVRNWGMDKPLCKNCQTPCDEHDYQYCSPECASISSRKTDRPPEGKLLKLLQNNSFTGVGRIFDVSDNAIRKWVKYYGYNPNTIRQELKELKEESA